MHEQERELPNSKQCSCMGDDPHWGLSVRQVPASQYVPPISWESKAESRHTETHWRCGAEVSVHILLSLQNISD